MVVLGVGYRAVDISSKSVISKQVNTRYDSSHIDA